MPRREHIDNQFLRYAVVGLLSNAAIYGSYLVLTYWGGEPKLVMTGLYVVGILQTYILNRRWSFRFSGALAPAFFRYTAAYLLGYLVNLVGLWVLVDRVGLPHQWVQGLMIVLVAAMLFACQKFWVFRVPPKSDFA